jgi:hypothetical protein
MAPDNAFVFLLHSPAVEQSQQDRIEQKLDRLTTLVQVQSELVHRLLESLADEGDPSDHPALTLDGTPTGQERDPGKSLG